MSYSWRTHSRRVFDQRFDSNPRNKPGDRRTSFSLHRAASKGNLLPPRTDRYVDATTSVLEHHWSNDLQLVFVYSKALHVIQVACHAGLMYKIEYVHLFIWLKECFSVLSPEPTLSSTRGVARSLMQQRSNNNSTNVALCENIPYASMPSMNARSG